MPSIIRSVKKEDSYAVKFYDFAIFKFTWSVNDVPDMPFGAAVIRHGTTKIYYNFIDKTNLRVITDYWEEVLNREQSIREYLSDHGWSGLDSMEIDNVTYVKGSTQSAIRQKQLAHDLTQLAVGTFFGHKF